MNRLRLTLRMSLGGAICGGYLGILAGACVGGLYGWWAGNLSFGLDGALIGGGLTALAGAVYGMVMGLEEFAGKPVPEREKSHQV